ncbi:MAG: type II toxin-antitoxin system Phd/YefM family antitoxin [Lawsonibacter sp.]|jgi:PHD/YefM family antitoxin component YafN of YafNO toxin-antitoxin module|nr:type II toxin-antitoxin system Phd/YefM family antitoxin [Lawsonibacter sp.]
MLHIRPVSDLRNKFPEIESTILQTGEPVYLTKNGYGSMVLLSLEQYAALTDDVELFLDEADRAAELSDLRCSGQEVFHRVRGRIHKRKAL